ncbi:hypothetical protein GUA87_03035 [Sneathiella sp. P13V-1]|uniref:hypothetical protein n=1 Tax=Sneathiella sp. P13V-1 TaxID=2697366 RepID=UPI00187B9E92|nr:hypothetical protein [Sneathiella sp. P13V-1]MBE7635801.1 hypothetical protein [Sneathiella sp. P13V-1]
MKLKIIASMGFLTLLTACGATTQTASTEAAAEVKPLAKTKKSEQPVETPVVVAKLPEEKPQPEPEPAFEVPEIDILKGKEVAEIEAVFGEPVLRRKDKPTEIWQYLSSSCALHLVFYPENGKTGPLTVQHIAMNDRESVKDVPVRACFESQLKKLGAEKVKELTS